VQANHVTIGLIHV